MLAAWLCCSVGATWTVELRSADQAPAETATAGLIVDWICTGVPTELPAPDAEITDLLAERGLLLFSDELVEPEPRVRSRRLIGHVTRDPAVLRLALMLADLIDEAVHPMALAAQWIEAGYSPDAATGWVTAGITWPAAAQTLLSSELDRRPEPLRVVPLELVSPTRWSGPG